MSYLSVFVPSMILTLIVGTFLALTWQQARRTVALAGYWGMAFVVHLAWFTMPHLGDIAPVARWLATVWIAIVVAATLLLIPFLVLTVAWRFVRRESVPAWTVASFTVLSLAIGLVAGVQSNATFIVRQEDVRIAGLPQALDGFRIAHLADIHVGRFIDIAELHRMMAAINRQQVDLLALTGDIADDATQLEATLLSVEGSRASHVAAILGNHEEMGDLATVLAAYKRHEPRIGLLIDGSTLLDHKGVALRVVGVSYPMSANGSHMLPRPEQDAAMSATAAKAFAGVREGEMVLALSHHPDFFPFASRHDVRLTLAGHTHGGQVKLFGRPVIVAYDHMHGRYQLGNSHLDVSAGAGHWLPLRIGVPREIVILTLRTS